MLIGKMFIVSKRLLTDYLYDFTVRLYLN